MTLTAALLLLASTTAHAGWNYLGKRGSAGPAFYLLANTLGVLCLVPVVLLNTGVLRAFTPALWGWLALTGLFQAIYYAGLAWAYRHGDMSFAYPLARSVPVLLVALANLALGRSAQISPLALAGMALIAGGGLLLPVQSFATWRPRNYGSLVGLFALVAAVGTTGYSLIDDHALRMLRTAAAPNPIVTTTLVYVFFEGLASSAWLALLVLLQANERAGLTTAAWRQAALAGIGIYLAYGLVLIAMAYVTNVSYVVAFRQTSILLGTLLGITLLKEPVYTPRLVGVVILFAGLVMVGVG